jgi:serine/threonine protein kinase
MSHLPLQSGFLLRQRYLITRMLHQKGSGAIYEARDTKQAGFMALRTVKEYLQQAPNDDFTARSALLMHLDHPSIPPTYEYFKERGATYHITGLIHGRDLEKILADTREKLPITAVHQWALELAQVVHYLHTHPNGAVIHRDIKPSNLMIDQRLRLQVVDFDIAGVFPKRYTGEPLGTDGYAAPEQYEGRVTPQIDIFGIGATLHHLLSRRDPRLDVPFSQVGVSVRLYNEAVSPAFDAVIQKSLAYDPADRYPSAWALLQALKGVTPLAS